ncbi:hypothetical protein [Nocardia nova]|uniref:hypothetical protein n=1 Tax=Nocardia nova TaxID=37330 RepID=UPI002738191B|nr:hypothetical protein [Nocardia nova]
MTDLRNQQLTVVIRKEIFGLVNNADKLSHSDVHGVAEVIGAKTVSRRYREVAA